MDNQKILDTAPEGATHVDDEDCYYIFKGFQSVFRSKDDQDWQFITWDLGTEYLRALSDIQKIVDLQTENDELRARVDRMSTFIKKHCEKWEGVAELEPSIQVLRRALQLRNQTSND